MGKRKTKRETPAAAGGPGKERPAVPVPSLLQILVECQSERQQQELFERLRQEGFSCRVLTL